MFSQDDENDDDARMGWAIIEDGPFLPGSNMNGFDWTRFVCKKLTFSPTSVIEEGRGERSVNAVIIAVSLSLSPLVIIG